MTVPIMRHQQVTFEGLKGLRAEGYVRDSTLDQRDGFGPEIQRHNVQRFAESYGLVLGNRWYTEFVSGRSMIKRKEFQQFIEDARLDLFDVLLVDHTSRFGRNQAECIRYKEEMRRLDKVVVFVSQGIISGSDRDFLSERINETLDEAYSRNLSRYITAGVWHKAQEGLALGKAPLGFRHAPNPQGKGVTAVADQETMPALLELLKAYASGQYSFRSLANHLNGKGYKTHTGLAFTASSVSTVLDNPFYEGKFIYHKRKSDAEMRQGVHQVPDEVKELWRLCREVRKEKLRAGRPSPKAKGNRVYPLSGVLMCDNCSEPFHGETTFHKDGTYSRMVHSRRLCAIRPYSQPAPVLERQFSQRVLPFIKLDDGWKEAIMGAMAGEGPQPDNALEVRRLEAAIANLRKQHMWGAVSDEEFQGEYTSLSRQLKVLQTPRTPTNLPNLERAAELLMELPGLWGHPGVTPETRRDLANEVFEEVRLKEQSLVAVKPRPQYAPLFAYSVLRQNSMGGDDPS